MSRTHYMKMTGLTKQERAFVVLMRIWAVVFFLAAIVYAFVPDYIPNYITRIGTAFFDWHAPPPHAGDDMFWVVMSVAMLITFSYLCAVVQRSPVRNMGYARPLILAKFVSFFGYAVCFLALGKQFTYLVAAVVDGSICFITWYFYAGAMKSRA